MHTNKSKSQKTHSDMTNRQNTKNAKKKQDQTKRHVDVEPKAKS